MASTSDFSRMCQSRLRPPNSCRKILVPYRKCAGVLKPGRARLCLAGAFAIGRFGRSRWLLAADVGELWGLLGSLKIRGSDCLAGAGLRK